MDPSLDDEESLSKSKSKSNSNSENDKDSTNFQYGKSRYCLSGEMRNCIQEEVHGVHCMNPEETPGFLRTSLSKLAEILESPDQIPERNKKAYLASQNLGSNTPTYVNTDDFRLRFLRADLFDIHKAARSIVKFLDVMEAIFGSFALERPPQLDDFDKEELKMIKMGTVQFLPFRDRVGRRIMVVFPNDHISKLDSVIKVRVRDAT